MTVDKSFSEMSWYGRPDEERGGKYHIKSLYSFLGDPPLQEASGVNELKIGTQSLSPVNALDPEGPDHDESEMHTDESEMHESPSNPLLQSDPCHPATSAHHPTRETLSKDTLPTRLSHDTPHDDFPSSPPIAPAVRRTLTTGFAPKQTPTRLGNLLLSANPGGAKHPPPRTLDTLWTSQDKEKFKDFYERSTAAKHVDVNAKKSKEYLKRCVKVATAMVIGPPTDPNWATQQEYALRLVFSTDIRSETMFLSKSDGSEIHTVQVKACAALGKYVTEHLGTTKPDKSLTIHLATRLSTLTMYQDNWVLPPRQMMWLLLAFHQLCFQDVAIAHPDLCGLPGFAPQTIVQHVHGDLARIFTLAEGHPLESRRVEYFKVSILRYLLADFG